MSEPQLTAAASVVSMVSFAVTVTVAVIMFTIVWCRWFKKESAANPSRSRNSIIQLATYDALHQMAGVTPPGQSVDGSTGVASDMEQRVESAFCESTGMSPTIVRHQVQIVEQAAEEVITGIETGAPLPTVLVTAAAHVAAAEFTSSTEPTSSP